MASESSDATTKLKAMRLSKKMTLEQVSQLIGVRRPTICAHEKKGIFDIRTAEKYAKAFKCPAFFLLERLDK